LGVEYYIISFVLDFDPNSPANLLNKNSVVGAKLMAVLWHNRNSQQQQQQQQQQELRKLFGDQNLEMLENCFLSNDFLPFLELLSHDRSDWNQSNRDEILSFIQKQVQQLHTQ